VGTADQRGITGRIRTVVVTARSLAGSRRHFDRGMVPPSRA